MHECYKSLVYKLQQSNVFDLTVIHFSTYIWNAEMQFRQEVIYIQNRISLKSRTKCVFHNSLAQYHVFSSLIDFRLWYFISISFFFTIFPSFSLIFAVRHSGFYSTNVYEWFLYSFSRPKIRK